MAVGSGMIDTTMDPMTIATFITVMKLIPLVARVYSDRAGFIDDFLFNFFYIDVSELHEARRTNPLSIFFRSVMLQAYRTRFR